MSPEDIIAEVASITGVPTPAIMGRRKRVAVVRARFLAIHAIRNVYDWWPLTQIGEFFGSDHSTVMNALARHDHFVATQEDYREQAYQLGEFIASAPAL